MVKKTAKFILILFFVALMLIGCNGAGLSPSPTPTFSPRPTPWGPPAKITANLNSPLTCKLSGSRCKEWQFTVTFTSENNLGAKVENMRMAFVSLENEIFTEGGYPTCVALTSAFSAPSTTHARREIKFREVSRFSDFSGEDSCIQPMA